MTLALTIGLLVGAAVYLILQREMLRVILGFILLSHGVNLTLMAAGGTTRRGEPLGGDLDPATTADPLPQAFVLTAIVIAFSITMFMLVLAVAGRREDDTHDDEPDDPDADDEAAGALGDGTDVRVPARAGIAAGDSPVHAGEGAS